MSVILDALKKLEREKLYQYKEASDISEEILKPDPESPEKRIRLYFIIIALTVVVTFAVTYAVIVHFGLLPGSSASKTANSYSLSKQKEIQKDTQKKEYQVHPKTKVPKRDKPDIQAGKPDKITPLAKIESPVESKASTASLNEKGERKKVVPEKIDGTAEISKKAVKDASDFFPESSTMPSLKISAIIWYEDPSERFAMINGKKAVEGSKIEGMKVVKIMPTGIRFLYNGRYSEISITR